MQEGRTDFRGRQASYAKREEGFAFCALEGSGRAGLLNARGGLNSGEAEGQTVFHAHGI